MNFLSFDTETFLIQPGLVAPQLVCVSTVTNQGDAELMDHVEGLEFMAEALARTDTIIIGHNVFYDLGVLCAEDPERMVPLVFLAFEEARIRDTIVRQQLIDIAAGDLKYRWDEATEQYVKTGYTLQDLAWRLLQKQLPKEGTFRLKFGTLFGQPISQWPAEAVEYACNDAVTTDEVFWKQEKIVHDEADEKPPRGLAIIPTQDRNTREAWALHLMSMWGIRTDAEAVRVLKEALTKEQDTAIEKLEPVGIYKKKRDGSYSKDMKKIYELIEQGFKNQKKQLPRTSTGKPSTEHDVLLEAGDENLKILAESAKGAKLLNTYVPLLEGGTKIGINARFNVLVESNRTSCSGPNLQNPPRKGGVRECFKARDGYVYCSTDYDTIELRSLAQTCLDLLGESAMAEALRAGEDLHLNLAAQFMGITKEEAAWRMAEGDEEVSEQRQLMKPANFGFPGGMAPESFVEYAKGYGFTIDVDLAKEIHENWHASWPEMKPYFKLVSALVGKHGEGKIVSPRSGFVRGGLSFTQACNHYFQSLTATGAKDALWNVTRECYNERKSPLWGSRPVIFMHDEIITEMPEKKAHEAARRQADVMVATMQKWIPDIPIKASPVLMRRWYKGAKPVYVDGKLVPSRPVKKDGKVTWEADL